MSLLMGTLPASSPGTPGARTEQRPRMLVQPDTNPDEEQQKLMSTTLKLSASSQHSAPYSRPHGNAKPQEPEFHASWNLSKKRPRMVSHPHPKPWTSSSCPGKYENPAGANRFHRVWTTDTGPRGRWNKELKQEFYRRYDEDLESKVPHDELHQRSTSNYKTWTHLVDGGLGAGGQEKLSYRYLGPNRSSTHIYVGKYDNVRHSQKILKTNWKDPNTEVLQELHKDMRKPFDVRLHDSILQATVKEQQWSLSSSFDVTRPKHTMSCPQLGADFLRG